MTETAAIQPRKLDVRKLRAFHRSLVLDRCPKLAGRSAAQIADDCARTLVEMESWLEERRSEIETGGFGSFARFAEVYAETLRRFDAILLHSFALDEDDPGGLFAEADRLVANALPFVEHPRTYALRALVGRPPFEPPGPLARALLDVRLRLADVERWKQVEFLAAWKRWGKLVWTLDHQAAWILTQLGDPVEGYDVAFLPFDERLRRLHAAKARKAAEDAARAQENGGAAQNALTP